MGGEFKRIANREQYAEIQLLVEPADAFEVVVDVDTENDDERFWASDFPHWAVLGLLDVVLVAGGQPLRDIEVTIIGGDHDPLWSSHMAFRFAGREAGKKLLEAEYPSARRL